MENENYFKISPNSHTFNRLNLFEDNYHKWKEATEKFKEFHKIHDKKIMFSDRLRFEEITSDDQEIYQGQLTQNNRWFKKNSLLNKDYISTLKASNVDFSLLNPFIVLNSFKKGKFNIYAIDYFYYKNNWYVHVVTKKTFLIGNEGETIAAQTYNAYKNSSLSKSC